MRLIDADELIEHVWRDRLDSRERIANLVKSMPSAEPQYTEQDMRDQFNAGYACGMETAQPEQRYSKEELMVFKHGISLSLLSKRSSQHWKYDEDTATEIEFLERLYDKVSADMRGEQK